MKQKCERPNETRGKKTKIKINPNAQVKYPVSKNSWSHWEGSTLLYFNIKCEVELARWFHLHLRIEPSWFSGSIFSQIKQRFLPTWLKNRFPSLIRLRCFVLFPAFVLRHFLSHACAAASRISFSGAFPAGEVPLDLADFLACNGLAPLQVLPRLAYFQSSSSGKTTLLRQKSQNNNVMSEFQLNLQKHVNIW